MDELKELLRMENELPKPCRHKFDVQIDNGPTFICSRCWSLAEDAQFGVETDIEGIQKTTMSGSDLGKKIRNEVLAAVNFEQKRQKLTMSCIANGNISMNAGLLGKVTWKIESYFGIQGYDEPCLKTVSICDTTEESIRRVIADLIDISSKMIVSGTGFSMKTDELQTITQVEVLGPSSRTTPNFIDPIGFEVTTDIYGNIYNKATGDKIIDTEDIDKMAKEVAEEVAEEVADAEIDNIKDNNYLISIEDNNYSGMPTKPRTGGQLPNIDVDQMTQEQRLELFKKLQESIGKTPEKSLNDIGIRKLQLGD